MTAAPSRPKTTAPQDSDEAIQRHVRSNLKSWMRRRFTATIAGIYELGGANGVVSWARARLRQGIGSVAEQQQLKSLLKVSDDADARWWRAVIKEQEEEEVAERLSYRERQLKCNRLLEERARQRQMAPDPRDEIRARLEQTLKRSPGAAPSKAQQIDLTVRVQQDRDPADRTVRAPLMRNEVAAQESAPRRRRHHP